MKEFLGDDDINWDEDARRAASEDVPTYEDISTFDYFSHLLKPGMRVLDLGCNISKWNKLFKNLGLIYDGLDASPTAIKIAKERFPENTYYLKKAQKMMFTNKYDVVFTHTVLQHMHLKTKKRVMPKVYRALKRDGYFIIEEKCDVKTKTTFTRQGWIDFICGYGFEYLGSTEPGDPRNGFIFRKKFSISQVKHIADAILEEWDDACKELGIPHFLYLGTCLGFYRDRGYIKFDEDIDVGILGGEENLKKLADKLLERGFVTKGEPEFKHWSKNGIFLDIWFQFPEFKEFLETFDEITYNSRVYSMPHPVEQYLEKEYGNWRIPQN